MGSAKIHRVSQVNKTDDYLNSLRIQKSNVIHHFPRLYGLTVAPAVGMLFELVRLGPLDAYLRLPTSLQTVKTVDMVEAAACLATALWHLVKSWFHLKLYNLHYSIGFRRSTESSMGI